MSTEGYGHAARIAELLEAERRREALEAEDAPANKALGALLAMTAAAYGPQDPPADGR